MAAFVPPLPVKSTASFADDALPAAVKAGKEYLSTQHFSRNGLIEQLSSPYGSKFTRAQAIYAVNKLGL